MSALVFPKYNQYDSFVRPLVSHLQSHGVTVRFGVRAYDLTMSADGETRTVTGIRTRTDGKDEVIPVEAEDV
ncbi:oleate hydratase, partial [Vibrio vulnificus]|uniref:oleate hydratase n=1 Tax=Vibrio vulnificus TaxID=672 RepID=UPI001F5149C2